MNNLRKCALVLCLTALFFLTGCGLQITIDVAPTATPLALPTSTSAATEETPTAPATASAPPTGTAAADPILATPAPTAPVTPTAAATTTPTATPAPTTTPAQSDEPSWAGASAAFGTRLLRIPEEIAEMRAQLGINGGDEEEDPVAYLLPVGDGYSCRFLTEKGTFYARYDAEMQRISCFYLENDCLQGYPAEKVRDLEENWQILVGDVPAANVPADTPRIQGVAADRFGKNVDVLCMVSDDGEILEYQYVFPQGSVDRWTEDYVILREDGKIACVVDLHNNVRKEIGEIPQGSLLYIDDRVMICEEGYTTDENWHTTYHIAGYTLAGEKLWTLDVPRGAGSVDLMEDGIYSMTATHREEKDYYIDAHDEAVYFFRADEAPWLAYEKGTVFGAIKEALSEREKNGYGFSLLDGYTLYFLAPDTICVIGDLSIFYNGEIDLSYDSIGVMRIKISAV